MSQNGCQFGQIDVHFESETRIPTMLVLLSQIRKGKGVFFSEQKTKTKAKYLHFIDKQVKHDTFLHFEIC